MHRSRSSRKQSIIFMVYVLTWQSLTIAHGKQLTHTKNSAAHLEKAYEQLLLLRAVMGLPKDVIVHHLIPHLERRGFYGFCSFKVTYDERAYLFCSMSHTLKRNIKAAFIKQYIYSLLHGAPCFDQRIVHTMLPENPSVASVSLKKITYPPHTYCQWNITVNTQEQSEDFCIGTEAFGAFAAESSKSLAEQPTSSEKVYANQMLSYGTKINHPPLAKKDLYAIESNIIFKVTYQTTNALNNYTDTIKVKMSVQDHEEQLISLKNLFLMNIVYYINQDRTAHQKSLFTAEEAYTFFNRWAKKQSYNNIDLKNFSFSLL